MLPLHLYAFVKFMRNNNDNKELLSEFIIQII